MTDQRLVGVAGATGRVGGAVLEELSARGVHSVVALSRSPLPAASLFDSEQRRLDYGEPSSLRAAFIGLDTLVFPGSDGDPAQMLRQHRAVVAAARRSSIRRVVYLSSVDADTGTPFGYARVHGATEAWLRASSFETVVLRASLFTEFFVETFVSPARDCGTLKLPVAPDVMLSLVSRGDVAAALAAAVADELLPAAAMTVSGPERMTLAEVAQAVSAVTGTAMQYEQVTLPEFRALRAAEGDPEWLVQAYVDLWSTSIASGFYSEPTPGLGALIGRRSRSLEAVIGCMPRSVRG